MKRIICYTLFTFFLCSSAHAVLIEYSITGGDKVSDLTGQNEFSYYFSGTMVLDDVDLFINPQFVDDPNDPYDYQSYLDQLQHIYAIPTFDLTVTVEDPNATGPYNFNGSTSIHLQENLDVAINGIPNNGNIYIYEQFMSSLGNWHVEDYIFSAPDFFRMDVESMDSILGNDYFAGGDGGWYADMRFTKVRSVPEPSTLLLSVIGIVGIGIVVRVLRPCLTMLPVQ